MLNFKKTDKSGFHVFVSFDLLKGSSEGKKNDSCHGTFSLEITMADTES